MQLGKSKKRWRSLQILTNLKSRHLNSDSRAHTSRTTSNPGTWVTYFRLKDKAGRDVVSRVKVNSNGLDPRFIGCTPIIDRAFVHRASLALLKKAFDGAVCMDELLLL